MLDLNAFRERIHSYAEQQPTSAQIKQEARENEIIAIGVRQEFVDFVEFGATEVRNELRERRAPAESFVLTGEGIRRRRVGGYVMRERVKYGSPKPPHEDTIELPEFYRRRPRLALSKLIILESSGKLAIACEDDDDRIVDANPSPLAWFREEAVRTEEDGHRYMDEAETDMNNMLTTYIAKS